MGSGRKVRAKVRVRLAVFGSARTLSYPSPDQVGEWAAADAEWPPAPLLTADQADATEPRVLRGLLGDEDIQAREI